MKTAMKDLTKIYIDLSKCSKKERKHIFSLLPEPLELDDYYIVDDYMFLTTRYSDDNYWIVTSESDIALCNKTELTYPEFIKLFENGSLSLQTKLEMFYDFLYERGVAKQLGVGIDTIVKHFIDEKLLSNDR